MKNLLFFACLFIAGRCVCQNTIGVPYIINYSKNVYHAGPQAYDIRQDDEGILYFATNDGLLSFDGARWQVYALPDETKVLSMAIGKDKKIYTGSQKEIGYFSPGKYGRLEYTSLTDQIPKEKQDFSEVWDVIAINNKIFFRANRNIYEYSAGRITAYKSVDWNFMGYSNGVLLAHDHKAGLVEYQDGRWIQLKAGKVIPETARITSFTPINKDSSLITTLKTGLFILSHGEITPFVSADIKTISENNVYDGKVIDNDMIALGTNLGGCYLIDRKGNIIQHLSKQNGLHNNNILSLFTDKEKNLWIGLDNGIDYVACNSAISQIFPNSQDRSSGYTASFYNNALYLGTANGLYRSPLSSPDISLSKANFELVKNSKGLVWNLSQVNGHLLMGHNEGAFVIDNNTAILIANNSGFWGFQPMSNISPSPWIIAGCYNGINFYNYENGKFTDKNIHAHFESALFTVIDNDVIWAMHPFNGLYRVTMKNNIPSYTVYKEQPEIFARSNNHLFKLKNRLVVTNKNGIFEYDHVHNRFIPSAYFDSIFSRSRVEYMKEDDNGNIWFIQAKRFGVVDLSEQSPRIVYFPELENKVVGGSHEFILPINNKNVLIGGEEGFYLLNYEKYLENHDSIPVLIRSVKGVGRSEKTFFEGYYPGDESGNSKTDIGFDFNSVLFQYATPVYRHQNTIEYSRYLEGFDKDWSEWTKNTEAAYTNLPVGSYTFCVKSHTSAGGASTISCYRFNILPPWYQSWWAMFAYFVALAFLGFSLYRQHEKKLKKQQLLHIKEQEQVKYLHQLELEHTESEIVRLENEKLANEIQYKNSELASTAMNMVQKNESFGKIKEAIVKLKKTAGNEQLDEDFKNIIRILDENRTQQDWEVFAQHFDNVYSDFLTALKEQYPFLTAGDAKLCAYLRLNFSCKEIAQLMSITVKSVELSRYRLRKKLQLSKEVNLVSFLASFHSEYKNRQKEGNGNSEI